MSNFMEQRRLEQTLRELGNQDIPPYKNIHCIYCGKGMLPINEIIPRPSHIIIQGLHGHFQCYREYRSEWIFNYIYDLKQMILRIGNKKNE